MMIIAISNLRHEDAISLQWLWFKLALRFLKFPFQNALILLESNSATRLRFAWLLVVAVAVWRVNQSSSCWSCWFVTLLITLSLLGFLFLLMCSFTLFAYVYVVVQFAYLFLCSHFMCKMKQSILSVLELFKDDFTIYFFNFFSFTSLLCALLRLTVIRDGGSNRLRSASTQSHNQLRRLLWQ